MEGNANNNTQPLLFLLQVFDVWKLRCRLHFKTAAQNSITSRLHFKTAAQNVTPCSDCPMGTVIPSLTLKEFGCCCGFNCRYSDPHALWSLL